MLKKVIGARTIHLEITICSTIRIWEAVMLVTNLKIFQYNRLLPGAVRDRILFLNVLPGSFAGSILILGHTRRFYPHLAPIRNVERRFFINNLYQIIPMGVSK